MLHYIISERTIAHEIDLLNALSEPSSFFTTHDFLIVFFHFPWHDFGQIVQKIVQKYYFTEEEKGKGKGEVKYL